MKDMNGNRLDNAGLCHLAGNYVEIINNSGIEELKTNSDFITLINLQHLLEEKSKQPSSEETISLGMRLTSAIKNIYRSVVAKEIETNQPQWISLSQRIFEKNESSTTHLQFH